MKKKFYPHLVALVSFCLVGSYPIMAADTVHVYAAASLSDVLKEISLNYRKVSDTKVILYLAASSLLARQIEAGAPADVFISADEAKMDYLTEKQLIKTETRKSLLSNTLVVITASDCSVAFDSIQTLADKKIRKIALAQPETVPAGIYAQAYLKKTQVWAKILSKIIPLDNVRAVLAAVESGNVDAGVVYKTDALLSKKIRIVLEITAEEGPLITYPFALIRTGKNLDKASHFLDYLQTPAAQVVFAKYGFIPLK